MRLRQSVLAAHRQQTLHLALTVRLDGEQMLVEHVLRVLGVGAEHVAGGDLPQLRLLEERVRVLGDDLLAQVDV